MYFSIWRAKLIQPHRTFRLLNLLLSLAASLWKLHIIDLESNWEAGISLEHPYGPKRRCKQLQPARHQVTLCGWKTYNRLYSDGVALNCALLKDAVPKLNSDNPSAGVVDGMGSADADQNVSLQQEASLSLEAELAVEFASGAVEGAAGLLHQDFEYLGNEVDYTTGLKHPLLLSVTVSEEDYARCRSQNGSQNTAAEQQAY